jgi:hypothetical protein
LHSKDAEYEKSVGELFSDGFFSRAIWGLKSSSKASRKKAMDVELSKQE